MKLSTFWRLCAYVLTTFLITFLTQLENFHFNVVDLQSKDMITLCIKSAIPCLISVKAFFDQTHSESQD